MSVNNSYLRKMKKIIILPVLLLSLLFSSCEKYVAGTTVTLSGKYLINRITIKYVDQNTAKDSTYRSGDVYIDTSTSTPTPFDRIKVGHTFIHFDYSILN